MVGRCVSIELMTIEQSSTASTSVMVGSGGLLAIWKWRPEECGSARRADHTANDVTTSRERAPVGGSAPGTGVMKEKSGANAETTRYL